MKRTVDALKDIIDHFQADPRHWTQGKYKEEYYQETEDGNGVYDASYCLVGALRQWLMCERVDVLDDLLHEDDWYGGYVEWNDNPGRSREDVVLLLKHAVIRLETEEEVLKGAL